MNSVIWLIFPLLFVLSGAEYCSVGEGQDNDCSKFSSSGDSNLDNVPTQEGEVPHSVSNGNTQSVSSEDNLPDDAQSVSSEDNLPDDAQSVSSEDNLPDDAHVLYCKAGSSSTPSGETIEPATSENENATLPGSSSETTRENITQGNVDSEFKCEFHWNETVLNRLKIKIVDWIKNREKSFHRFIVPVMGFKSDIPSMGNNFTGVLIWVWYQERYKYMLHFPHNFVTISLQTMGVVTQDWALDYYDKSFIPASLTLSGNSINIKDGAYQYKSNLGHCDRECLQSNQSCGLGKHDMVKFLTKIENASGGFQWDYLCLQLEYTDVHSVAQTGSRPNHLTPDLLYYAMFLKKLLTERWFGLPIEKDKFLQYHCYKKSNLIEVESRELLEKYFVIPGVLALLLWLYFPLLLHYFPSSSKEVNKISQDCPEGMFPSHKMPVYFGRCLKFLFCFYIEGDSTLIRLRRVICLTALLLSSFRLLYLPTYWMYFVCVAFVLLLVCSYPAHISSHIDAGKVLDSNERFAVFGWKFWPGLIKVNPAMKEYQLLAAMMQERVYLILDANFWRFLIEMSFKDVSHSTGTAKCWLILRGLFQFVVALVVYFCCYFTPLPYFLVEMTSTIFRFSGQQIKLTALLYRIVFLAAFVYSIAVAYFWCCVIIEFSIFTLYGGVISPSIIVPYFVLLGSTVRTIHLLIHSLHEHYDEILKIIIEKLKSETDFKSVAEIEKKEDDVSSNYTISVTDRTQNKVDLMRHSVPVVYVSRKLYDFVVEKTSPVRRYVFFIIIQVIAILVYAGIVLSVKNVFHLEKQVGYIFQIISNVAVIFIPGILKFLAYKSHYGKKEDEVMKKNIYFAMTDFLSKL